MFQSIKRFAGVVAVAVGVFAPQAFAQATYYTNTDNENNAGTHVADNDMDVSLGNASGIHPIEFNINVATLPMSSVVLGVKALDVDEEQGEVDDVYLNGHHLGRLSGADSVWSVTAFNVNPAWLVARVRTSCASTSTPAVISCVGHHDRLGVDLGAATRHGALAPGPRLAARLRQSVRITGTFVAAGNVTISTPRRRCTSITGGTYRLQDQPHRPQQRRRDGLHARTSLVGRGIRISR